MGDVGSSSRVPALMNMTVWGFASAAACHAVVPVKGDVMGREARVALLLAAAACLLAVTVERATRRPSLPGPMRYFSGSRPG